MLNMAVSTFINPFTTNNVIPGIKKLAKGALDKYAVDMPILLPVGSIMNNVPAMIALTPVKKRRIIEAVFNFLKCFCNLSIHIQIRFQIYRWQ